MNPAWLDAVVLLRLGSGVCAGTLVAPDRVLTAWHCVADGGRPSVEWRDGARVVGRVVAADHARDLAIVSVPAQDRPTLPVADAPPPVGAAVHVLGHPLGADPPAGFFAGTLRWSAVPGAVAAVGDDAVQLAATLSPGQSGGPVVDVRGEVVGVVSRRLGGGPAFAGRADAVPAELAAPAWRTGVGATLSAAVVLADHPSPDGLLAGGGRLALAVHDRVWLSGGLFAPWAPLASAERWGEGRAVVADGLVGLRQRLGRGPFSTRVDAFAGAGAVQSWRPRGGAVTPTLLVGGRVSARSLGVEVTVAPGEDLVRAALIVGWPGTLAVF